MPLTNTQFDAVMRRYDEIRERNRYELQQRTAEAFREIPELISLSDETAARSLEAARMRIEDPDADLTEYRKQIAAITDEKQALLISHGYDPDYLDLRYDCPYCKDTGIIDGRHCSCFDRIAAELLYGRYGLREILRTENFSRFSFDWYSDTMVDETTGKTPRETAREAVAAARDLFDGQHISGNLYLYGPTGVGKTFLTHCIAKEALDLGLGVLYFSAGEFFEILADSTFEKGPGRTAARSLTSSCDLLIIDDLGTELTNSFTASALFRVINERLSGKRSTVISTNLSLRELSEKYSERVLSRITSEFTIFRLTGEDIRIRKKLIGGLK